MSSGDSVELGDVVRKRRSIRKYGPGDVPEEHVKLMLEAAMMAPSARNSRPWEFVVIRDAEARRKLAESHPYCKANDVPVVIVVCGFPDLSEFWQQDCGAAAQNILLTAADLGYGACWCGVHPTDRTEKVKAIIKRDSIPVMAITVGFAAESPDARGRYESGKVIEI